MAEAWLTQAADAFWTLAGGPMQSPRDVGAVVSRSLPLCVVSLSDLSVASVERWFGHQRVPYRFLCQDRELCGCIVAARGSGLLFIDAEDPSNEQRFTIAHEVAHFLLDYEAPRRQALELFGETIRPVLDGERAPTSVERIHAVLSAINLGIYVDMMPRSSTGGVAQDSILRAEERADRLALELLAPADQVLTSLSPTGTHLEQVRRLTALLDDQYGLPRLVARTYAVTLVQQYTRPSMAEWLGL